MSTVNPRNAGLSVLLALAAAILSAAPAQAEIVLLSTASGAPSSQDANLVDWQGRWVSALDRAAPLPGQLPPWQVNVGLWGDDYTPPNSEVVQPNPVCEIRLQISGSPAVDTAFDPCVEGPTRHGLGGQSNNPTLEELNPELSEAPNAQHTVTITAYNEWGGQSSTTSFNVEVDNVAPSAPSMVGPVGWQKGGEVITSTAMTDGLSGISGQWCSIAGSTPSWYPGSTAELAVTGNGSIPVRCAPQNGAGVTGPTTEHDAMLDNASPTGYFAPRDPNSPARATVVVADSESGVAAGQIEMHSSSGWQALASSYDSSTGRLIATLPDDATVPDGNYSLRALVTNAVGTQATITTDENGAPEVITEPLRIVTQLPVGASRAMRRRCTLTRRRIRSLSRRHQSPAARLIRHCTEVAVPRTRGPVALRYGQDATVSGLLQTADGNPIADTTVQVTQQAAGWTTQRLGRVTTDSHGRFTYAIPAGPSRAIRFSFPGSATLRPAAGSTSVEVSGRSTVRMPSQTRAGHRVVLSGRVLGGFIPTGGVLVQLQYDVVGYPEGWQPFGAAVRTNRHGYWHVVFPLAAQAAGFTYRFRAEIHSQPGWPYATANSEAISRHIT